MHEVRLDPPKGLSYGGGGVAADDSIWVSTFQSDPQTGHGRTKLIHIESDGSQHKIDVGIVDNGIDALVPLADGRMLMIYVDPLVSYSAALPLRLYGKTVDPDGSVGNRFEIGHQSYLGSTVAISGNKLHLITNDTGKNHEVLAETGHIFDIAFQTRGTRADDRITGSHHNNELVGYAGNDTLIGGRDRDTLTGGAGNDREAGCLGDDVLYGNAGHDSLAGGAGRDSLIGGSGNDTLTGGDGVDRLRGEEGSNLLIGGAGRDYFVFASPTGHDIINDWQQGMDRLDFRMMKDVHGLSDLKGSISGNVWTISHGDFSVQLASAAAHLVETDFLFAA